MVAKAAKETEETPGTETEVEVEEVVPEAAPPVGPKRQLGVKEPIVFKWKILGGSEGVVLTLFKAVEREEADAQLDRLQKEGYYKDLRVVENTEKVVQPKPPPPPRPASAKASPTPKAVKPPAKKAAAVSKPIRVPKASPPKEKGPKPKAKTEPKAAKKKAVAGAGKKKKK